MCTRAALVGMAVGERGGLGEKPTSPCALTVHWPQPPRRTLPTAAAPHPSLQSSAGLQLEQIAAAGTEKALLAGVAQKNPGASCVELLRLFKVRRSAAARHSQPRMAASRLLRVAGERPFAAAAP